MHLLQCARKNASTIYDADLMMIQGRGNFNMEMHYYDVVPGQLQEKIIEKAKAERGEVKEEEE